MLDACDWLDLLGLALYGVCGLLVLLIVCCGGCLAAGGLA